MLHFCEFCELRILLCGCCASPACRLRAQSANCARSSYRSQLVITGGLNDVCAQVDKEVEKAEKVKKRKEVKPEKDQPQLKR